MRRTRFILAFVQFVDVAALTLILATLPATSGHYGLTLPGALLAAGIVILAAGVSAPLLLRASERWGRKPVLVATGLLTAEALLVSAWASDVYMLVLARVGLGVAIADVAVVIAAGSDLVRHHGALPEPPHLAVRGYALGLVGGPVLALALSPLGYGVPAYAAAVLAVVALVEIVALLEETCPAECRDRRATAS